MALNFSDNLDAARQALASLELFAGHYASSAPFQEHKERVIAVLSERNKNRPLGDPNDNFLSHFCEAVRKL